MNRLFNLPEERSRDACQRMVFQVIPALHVAPLLERGDIIIRDQMVMYGGTPNPTGLPPTQQTRFYQDGNGGGDNSFAHSGWMDLHSDFRNAP